ncbi:hypothetical protein AU186_22830 [Mycobacterium sp. GA-1999]|nr:hypothetical protein AU186_22830 [Mycobacterium sp. GA-1999]KUH91443.1 hypothetical protein AU185_09895 [Mycobacterium sp. GA-0227b]KUH96304.1 hypothetical protein AU187_13950 [Mycobacterium sp. IS-1556]
MLRGVIGRAGRVGSPAVEEDFRPGTGFGDEDLSVVDLNGSFGSCCLRYVHLGLLDKLLIRQSAARLLVYNL